MKSKEVLHLLRVTRPTLAKYVKEGIIKTDRLPNGRYEYDTDSVYAFLNKDVKRRTYLYARVSGADRRADMEEQIRQLKQFCFARGYVISGIYTDVASGVGFEKRDDLFRMLDDIIDYKVERVVITYRDRLSRDGFAFFSHLFRKYHCEISVMSEVGSEELDRQEMPEEIGRLLRCYSMELYGQSKMRQIREVLDGEN